MTDSSTVYRFAKPALMTVKDIAVLDRCSEKTVRRAIKAGLLKTLRVGPAQRLIRISEEAHASYRRGQDL